MPKSISKQRTISYFRARWEADPELSLEGALKACLNACLSVDSTQIELRTMLAELRHRRLTRDTVYLHVAAWTQGESASIVPHAARGDAADLGERAPDEDWDFLDGDGMVLVSGDHCLLMPSGLHPKTLELYVRYLLRHGREECGADIPDDIDRFELLAVANAEVTEQIQRDGVKKFHLNVGQYLETAVTQVEEHLTIRQRIGRAILDSLVADEDDRRMIEEAENVQARLIISCDKRRPGLEPDSLASIAQKIVDEEEDQIEIETGAGQRIQRGQLVLRKPVDVTSFAKTVHHEEAWDNMAQYLEELRTSNVLQQ